MLPQLLDRMVMDRVAEGEEQDAGELTVMKAGVECFQPVNLLADGIRHPRGSAGRVTDAVPLLTQALEQTIAEDTAEHQVFYTLSLGEAHTLAGHLDDAHALAERALALARELHERGNQAYALRLLGEIAARREPPKAGQAETHYCEAIALAGELGMRPLQAHCHLGLGTLHVKTAQHELARPELSVAINLYRAMDMTFWLPQTEGALAQIAGQKGQADSA